MCWAQYRAPGFGAAALAETKELVAGFRPWQFVVKIAPIGWLSGTCIQERTLPATSCAARAWSHRRARSGLLGRRIRGAVLRPLRGMGDDPFLGARDAALHIAHGALQAVTQNMKPASVPAGIGGIGHGGSFDGYGAAVCAPRQQRLPSGDHSLANQPVLGVAL